jgi:hypothetical protein
VLWQRLVHCFLVSLIGCFGYSEDAEKDLDGHDIISPMRHWLPLFLLAVVTFAQAPGPEHYLVVFISAETYKDGSPHDKAVYLSGWLASRLNAGFVGAPAKAIKPLRDCMEGKTVTQVTAIVDRYILAHPETWERPAALEADQAIREVCPAFREVTL